MSSKNKLLTMLILGSGAAASMALINKYIQISASGKNILEDSESLCYRWRFGNIHYKRTGNRIFKMAPLHHHFELCGWKENKIVSVFSLVSLLAAMIGLMAI